MTLRKGENDRALRDVGDAREKVLSRLQGICAMQRRARGLEPPLAPPRPDAGELADPQRRLAVFTERAEAAGAVVEVRACMAEVPDSVATIVRRHGLKARPLWLPDPALTGLDWPAAGLVVHAGAAPPLSCMEDGYLAVTPVIHALAETGSIMLASGPSHPASAAFLPRVHVAVVPADRIVPGLDDVWETLRDAGGRGTMPRAVNWITGPSRTADIEQTLVEGAHGPARLHVLVVRGG